MAWIESHDNLADHPKLNELCFVLNLKKHEAVGHLTLLWHFTLKYAWRDGDLRRFSPRIICEAVGWDKDHDTLINALRQTGWLDPDTLRVHDWFQYAGKLVKDRAYKERRRKAATKYDKKRQTAATVPNHTVPNQERDIVASKQQNDLNQSETTRSASRFAKPTTLEIEAYCRQIGYQLNAQKFFDYYESNGWRVGRNPMKDWKAAVRTWRSKEPPKPKEVVV